MKISPTLLLLSMTTALFGCLPEKVDYAAKPATAIDPKTRSMDYWLDQPAVASARSTNFDALWNAANRAMSAHSFQVDLSDYREGKLTSRPLVSKMPFEFWKNDVVDVHSQVECALSTMMRTVQLRIHQQDDGQYVCEPKVVVLRYAMPERRITSVTEYTEAFSIRRPAINGSSEEGDPLPLEYWYSVGRDESLEKALADTMRQALGRSVAAAR